MQNKYSLANAMAKDGREIFAGADGANDAEIVNPGALGPESTEGTAPLSGMVLALTNADLKLNELAQSLGILRENVDSLGTSLSLLKAADTQPLKTQAHAETTKVAEVKSTQSDDRRLTREAMTVGTGRALDPVAALQYSNANLSFETTKTSEKSITVLREESTASEKRLSSTLEPAPIWGESLWLKAKTGIVESTNSFVEDSPAAASTLKTTGAVVSSVVTPVISEFFSGLGETIKTRVTGNVVDATLGRIPGIGKLFKDGGYDKDQEKGAEQSKGQCQQCCSPAAASLGTLGALDAPSAQLPESVGETAREKEKARPKRRSKGPRGKRNKSRQQGSREIKTSVVRKSADLKSQRSAPAAKVSPPINVMGQPQLPFDSKRVSQASPRLPGNSFASPAASSTARPRVRGASKSMAAGLSGVLAKLESAGARRLGPLKYVDTAVDVIQGVRNGDAKAVGSGLSSAGGAWAGASAGAAIGTLVFPGVGTAVGGAIGGLLGSEAGAWLGDKLFSSSDRLPAPAAVSKELNSARTDNVQVTLAPSIQITGVNPADAQQVVNQVIQALQFQCMPMLTDSLGIRRNVALADPSGGD
ncbi:phage tail tape measure protein [Pseudomonas sp. D47]|uniref:phage tail tape measure protein n=1 Tax=Pseudomonas sp. D47 TaxID=3159447 RepID=UPI00387B45CC